MRPIHKQLSDVMRRGIQTVSALGRLLKIIANVKLPAPREPLFRLFPRFSYLDEKSGQGVSIQPITTATPSNRAAFTSTANATL
jgi:hypothetical protein